MCSRFEVQTQPASIQARFGVPIFALPNKAEVRPTDIGLVIGAEGGALQIWGLRPSWDGGGPLVNARCETLDQKPSFKELVNRRVLVPATAWWEWTRGPKGRPDQKMRLRLQDSDMFAFAGLTDGERFTIVTCDAVTEMAAMNDRMPVILPQQVWADWLSPAVPYDAVKECLQSQSGLVIEPDGEAGPQLSLF